MMMMRYQTAREDRPGTQLAPLAGCRMERGLLISTEAELHQTPRMGDPETGDVSPDASWSYAFASPTTKTRTARSRPGDSKSPAPGLPCEQAQHSAAILEHWLAGGRGWGARGSTDLQKEALHTCQ